MELVRKAIISGLVGCVDWDERVVARLESEFAKHRLDLDGIRRRLIDHVRNGGKIYQVTEKRKKMVGLRRDWYKVIVPYPGLLAKGLFVEIVLSDPDDPHHDLPEVLMVNAHE